MSREFKKHVSSKPKSPAKVGEALESGFSLTKSGAPVKEAPQAGTPEWGDDKPESQGTTRGNPDPLIEAFETFRGLIGNLAAGTGDQIVLTTTAPASSERAPLISIRRVSNGVGTPVELSATKAPGAGVNS